MELLDGQTLRGKLGAGPIPQREAIDYALQIAKGLAAAHERGVLHRDLKPENMFVTKDDHIKILDFGLAKRVEPVSQGDPLARARSGTVGLVFSDSTRSRENFHLPSFYLESRPKLELDVTRTVISVPIADAWYGGAPYQVGKRYPSVSGGQIEEMYVPEIQQLEIDVEHVDRRLVPDSHGMFPQPSVYLSHQIRWLSGRQGRAHASVVASFVDKGEQFRVQYRAFQAGVSFAILSSLSLAAALDFLWTAFTASK